MNLKKGHDLGFLFLCIIFLATSALSFVEADSLHSHPGPDTSPDGLILTDLLVEGPRELGQARALMLPTN